MRAFLSRWRRLLGRAALVVAAWFVVHTIVTTKDGLDDTDASADVAVLFGNAVEPNGTPAPRLRSRLDKGVELYIQKRVKKLLATGGPLRHGYNEGDVMRAYLVQHGVPDADILVDDDATDTWENGARAAALMRAGGLTTAIAVSNYWHLTRAKLALSKAGVHTVGSVHASFVELSDPINFVREFFAFYVYVFR